jgi:formate hydrogenlyase subunit 3/multisubunit Na+/H+ antiporter MnhD subunit
MNPISLLLLCVLVLLLSAWRVMKTQSLSERRWVALIGASASALGCLASLFWTLEGGSSASLQLGALSLNADRVTYTLAPVLSLSVVAFVMALPRRELSRATLARALSTLALSLGALMAGELVSLLTLEVISAFILASAAQRRASRALLSTSALLAFSVLMWRLLTPSPPLEPFGVTWLAALPLFVSVALRLSAPLTATLLRSELREGLSASQLSLITPLGGVMITLRVLHPLLETARDVAHLLMMALLALSLMYALASLTRSKLSQSLAYLISASHGVLIVGLIEPSEVSFVGGELLWSAVLLAEVGLTLSYALVESRVGPISLSRHHGLQQHMPLLARASLLLSLSLAASPGSMDFIAVEMLLSGEVTHSLLGALLMSGALSAIAFGLMRAHFRVFFGPSAQHQIPLEALPREGYAFALILITLLVGGLAPSLLPLLQGG